MANVIIETFDLTKKYKLKGQKKEIIALTNANISIKEGEIFGLLGPNGAGKTTMIQILSSIIQPTSGYAIIDGFNIITNSKKTKNRIALMLDSSMIYYRITGYDNLKFYCKMYNVPNYKEKIFEMAKELELEKWLNQYVEKFSSGMKMKLALCRTLLLNRKVLILDEPTLGLDVQTRAFIINKLKNLDKTIFLASHDMDMVEKLCDRIAFINKGEILKIGKKEDIEKLEQTKIKIEIEVNGEINQLKSALNSQEFVKDVIETKNGIVIMLNNRTSYNELLLILSKYKVSMVREQVPTLEDLFFKII